MVQDEKIDQEDSDEQSGSSDVGANFQRKFVQQKTLGPKLEFPSRIQKKNSSQMDSEVSDLEIQQIDLSSIYFYKKTFKMDKTHQIQCF